MTGQTFYRLTAIQPLLIKGRRVWEFKCVCGGRTIAALYDVRSGHTKSCGCLRNELLSQRRKTHGDRTSVEYYIWAAIKRRCYNPNTKDFENYGGRGIVMDDQFRDDFQAFLDHVGRRPSPKHTIERINNDGNYEPGNLRWATRTEQNNNKRNIRVVHFMGKTASVAWHCRTLNLSYSRVMRRIYSQHMLADYALYYCHRQQQSLKGKKNASLLQPPVN